jgi:SAM-dependent methyltransferase
MSAPSLPPWDHSAALAQYQLRARIYDLELTLFEPVRRQAIERLELRHGDVVLDVGCGTGLSLPLLHAGIGARGRIIGIEQCPEMIEIARQRVTQHAWTNVQLIEESADAARSEAIGDAALFVFTHDILREPLALANVMRSLRPGARVVACGLQWAGFWAWPLNLLVLGAALHSVTSLDGLDRPWSRLVGYLDDLQVDEAMAGTVFIASGSIRSGAHAKRRTSHARRLP